MGSHIVRGGGSEAGKIEKWAFYKKIEKLYHGFRNTTTLIGFIIMLTLVFTAVFAPYVLEKVAVLCLGLFVYSFGITLGILLVLKRIGKEECLE